MVRSAVTILILFCVGHLAGVEAIVTEADAISAKSQALADLRAGDNDQEKTVVAALKFTELLDYYKRTGDNDQICEMQAYIYWCKKRMNIEVLRAYVAAKGAPAQALASKAEQVVGTEVSNDQADTYFERAEVYARAMPKDAMGIAVRYFEVADRFTGTPVSLKAQRASLEAMQKAALAPALGGEDLLSGNFRIPTVTAADMPESAQKLIVLSNQVVQVITTKAGTEMGKERAKILDLLVREAESSQRKGELDLMLVHQTQSKDLDKDQKGLTRSATTAMDAYRKAKRAIIGKAALAVIEERKKMIRSLSSLQSEETKKGNTAGALAIKVACNKLTQELADASTTTLAGMKEPDRPFIIKPEGGVLLSTLNPKMSDGDIKISKNQKEATVVVMVEGKRCFEYIWAHAPSEVAFDIPPGVKQFTAYGMSLSSQSVKFIVSIDGKEKFSGSPDGVMGGLVPVNVRIHEGAKRISMVVDPLGSNNADHSLWAYPYFTK